MPKATESSDLRGKPPAFLQVGAQLPGAQPRVRLGEQHLRKMFDWWNVMAPTLREKGGESIGIPALRLAEELGLRRPTNANSFRANLQRSFDKLSIDGRTMFLALRGAGSDKFELLPETTIWFRPVSASERKTGRRAQ
jgi:hypothetical protein